MRNYPVLGLAVAATAVSLSFQPVTQAILVPAAGPGTGTAQVAHQLVAKGAASAVPIFQAPANYVPNPGIGGAGGGMQSPGGGFRTLGGLIAQNQNPFGLIANVPVTQITPAGALGAAWGGATTTVLGIAGAGRAGISISNAKVSNVGAATESANSTGASADYINVGAAIVGARYAQFISNIATVDGVGGFATAAVRSRVQIDPFGLVGGAFGTLGGVVTVQPNDLLMGFDGVGGNADFLVGADAGKSLFAPVGNNLTFAGIASTGAFNIPLGASVRISGAVTFIGDPASIDMIDLPFAMPDDILVGMGDASNADNVLPEPGSLAMLVGLGFGGMLRTRRRRTLA